MSVPIALGLIIVFGVIVVVGFETIENIVLRKAQIKADAMVRAEEVKAKNQLELEKLIHKDYENSNTMDISGDDRKVREKI